MDNITEDTTGQASATAFALIGGATLAAAALGGLASPASYARSAGSSV
jgi:hypothetical protein